MSLRFISLALVIGVIFGSCQNTEDLGYFSSYTNERIKSQEFTDFLNEHMDSLDIPAISMAVINNGSIAYEQSFGRSNLLTEEDINSSHIFEAASLSKPVFAYFVLRLAEKGIIDLNRPLHFYLPDESMEVDPRYKNITAQDVLSHNTGFPNWRWFSDIPDSINIERGTFFMLKDPGSGFTYSGEAYQYLARVIAHLNFVKMNELQEIFNEEVSVPLQIEHFYFTWDNYLSAFKVYGHEDGEVRKRTWGAGLPHHNSMIFQAAGGLHTNAQSYGRFICALIDSNGLSKESFQLMYTPYTTIPEDNHNFIEDGVSAWSLGMAIRYLDSDTLYIHGGNNSDFQSEFLFSSKKKFGYVFFVNCDKGNELNSIIRAYLDLPDT